MSADEPPYKHARRRVGEDRKKMLRFLYDHSEPVSISYLEEQAGASRGSRNLNLNWLCANLGNVEWWPEDLGPLIRETDRAGPRNTRYFEITEDGEKFVESLRESREIKTDADFRDLRQGFERLDERLDDLPEQVEENDDRIGNLADQVESIREDLKTIDEYLGRIDTRMSRIEERSD